MPINTMHAFLQIDTIQGESQDAGHKNWIEITDYDFDCLQPRSATASSVGGQTAARVELSPISVVKKIDKASPVLFQACATGATYKNAKLEFYRADKDGKAVKYFMVELLNVLVHRLTSRVGEDGLIQETLQLSFGAIKQTYTQQLAGGGQGGQVPGSWSQTLNTTSFSVN